MHTKNLDYFVAASVALFAEHREEEREEDMDDNDNENENENEGEESSLKMWKN